MQRVNVTLGFAGAHCFLHGAPGGDERLAGDLAAEDPLALLVGALAAEDVDLDPLEVEQSIEIVERRS